MKHYLKMLLWRAQTRIKLLWPGHRRKIVEGWMKAPHLFNARHYAEASVGAFGTLAGDYNDHTPGGFMTEKQARRLFFKEIVYGRRKDS